MASFLFSSYAWALQLPACSLCYTSRIYITCYFLLLFFTAVFRENRITIVITYFEEWYIDDQRPTVQEVKDDICCSIKDRVGQCHIPEDCLIPVCGMWANTARRLQSTPSERTEASLQLERKARLYWKLYKKATSGRDANERLQPVEIASKLLVASGIKHVEQRYRTDTLYDINKPL